MKICIFGVLEPSGLSKSDLWLKNDSFWWGAGLRTDQIRLFHILNPGLWFQGSGLRSQFSGLRSQVSGLRSQVSGLRSQVSGLRSQVPGLRSQVFGLRSQVSGLRSLGVFGVSLGLCGCLRGVYRVHRRSLGNGSGNPEVPTFLQPHRPSPINLLDMIYKS